MHLQHLDELMEDYLYLQLNGERLGAHDIEMYRQLRGHHENPKDAEIVASLNCGSFGDHYPHRYQVMLPFAREKRSLPTAVVWRLDAAAISLHREDADENYLPVSAINNNKFV